MKLVLQEIIATMRDRSALIEKWAPTAKWKGGVVVLFAGPNGPGKAKAAQILAKETGKDISRVDLASVVSKYIGETEKNLNRLFDAAQETGAILFFDEADALFGKRTDVKDAHDRYANIEISYLLQRLENYRGLAIIATNDKSNLDDAFVRRIHHVIEFPFSES